MQGVRIGLNEVKHFLENDALSIAARVGVHNNKLLFFCVFLPECAMCISDKHILQIVKKKKMIVQLIFN